MSRRFSKRQRRILALLASGRCSECSEPLGPGFHADHRHPYSHGGPTILRNGQALCAPCNLKKANKVNTTRNTNGLRDWQMQCLHKALAWFETSGDRHFVINAAPGAGKTRAAIVIAAELLNRGLIERVVVIAPRGGVVDQWSSAFKQIIGRPMARLTGQDDSMAAVSEHVCATWSAVAGLADAFQAICRARSTMVICDEQHHAAITAAWGRAADSAFADASYVLVLTGTPVRSDGAQSLWLPHNEAGIATHPVAGTYTLTYGEAVDLGYCRPATFHRHWGRFSVVEGDHSFEVSSDDKVPVPHDHPAIAAIQKTLDFYKLAMRLEYEPDGTTPLRSGYQAAMIDEASLKLDDLRMQMPDAGGLVIAPSIDAAGYFAKLIKLVENEEAIVVHSNTPNPDAKISRFRNDGDIRWLVSVGMVSEGIDIPRLRVLVFLPKGQTELVFRQALGRVVRSNGPDDRTRAYVVMPAWKVFEDYARRIEDDMPVGGFSQEERSATRLCPSCKESNPRDAKECCGCGLVFPAPEPPTLRVCSSCHALTPARASRCQTCGALEHATHSITLAQAARAGVIARGVSINEADVVLAEASAAQYVSGIDASADLRVTSILSRIPVELMPILARFFAGIPSQSDVTSNTPGDPSA